MLDLEGAEKYSSNVDTLSGRTFLGSFLFKGAKINLHTITEEAPNKLRTRWTLSVCFIALPWQPMPRFTGISEYTLDAGGLIIEQRDYWDSVNLKNGASLFVSILLLYWRYEQVPTLEGLRDFAMQLLPDSEASGAAESELPFELLRRAAGYEVRRYPARHVARTAYTTRPEGFDRLGSYVGGTNAADTRLQPFSPSLIRVPVAGEGRKTMEWPLAFVYPDGEVCVPFIFNRSPPDPLVASIAIVEEGAAVVAVLKFSDPTTEPAVKYYTQELRKYVEADGLIASVDAADKYLVAQYNAIFTFSKRRNEVWLPLDGHDWK
ncbi:unnamed protein product [Phaeothamnion confervicola]